MAQEDIKLKVGLEDKASEGLKQLNKNVKNFAKGFEEASPFVKVHTQYLKEFDKSVNELNKEMISGTSSVGGFGDAFGNLVGPVLVALAALVSVKIVVGEISDYMKEAISNATDFEQSFLVLGASAKAFGMDLETTFLSAQKLSDDGLVNLADSSKGLALLMETGLSIDQAYQAMDRFKDIVALGDKGNRTYTQAVNAMTIAMISGYSITSRRLGLQQTWNELEKRGAILLGFTNEELTHREKMEARLAGMLEVTTAQKGQSALASETLAGSEATLESATKTLSAQIGYVFSPVVKAARLAMTEFAQNIFATILPALKVLAHGLNIAYTNFLLVAESVRATIGSFAAWARVVREFSFDPLVEHTKETWGRMRAILEDESKRAEKISGMTVDNIAQAVKDMVADVGQKTTDWMDEIVDKGSEAARKIREAIERESRNFRRAIERQFKRFEDNLRDLVISHREKVEELGEQMKEETDSFEENMQERKERFDKTMADIEDRHKKKVERIKDQVEDERKEMVEEIDEVTDKYKEQFIQFDIATKDRLNSLKVQLDREIAKGRYADKQKIRNLEKMLAEEKKALEEQREFRTGERDSEIQEVVDEHQEKLDDLQAKLDEEINEVQEARLEKETEYEKETAKIQQEHAKRLLSLQEELNLEKEIQKRHADDFAKFQDAVREDDIARLKRKFAEEKVLLEQQHKDRLDDIARRAKEERQTREAEAVRTNQNLQVAYNRQAQQTAQTAQKASERVQQSLRPTFEPSPVAVPSAQPAGPSFLGTIASSVSDFVSRAFGAVKGFFGFQHGGIVTRPTLGLVGEAGPEAILPLRDPRRMREIMTKAGIGNGVNIGNMPVTIINNDIDIDMLLERIDFMANKGGLV